VAERPIKIRLAEIDTPERGQPWAARAKQALSDTVFRKQVDVRVVDTDRYGRTVGLVWIGDRPINREMVRKGHAWVYRKYLRDETLLNDEAHAREADVWLWSLPEAQRVPSWQWRRGKPGNSSICLAQPAARDPTPLTQVALRRDPAFADSGHLAHQISS
jgi:endonuclease YncB( thermonuclease family)